VEPAGTGASCAADSLDAPTVGRSVHAARLGRRVVLVRLPDDDDITIFRASVARRKGLTIAVVRRMGEVSPRAIDHVHRGVDAASVVSQCYALQDVGDALASAARRTGLKVVADLPRSP
jgi:L-iditol 2-dehydrogenase